MRSSSQHLFSRVPQAEIPRSSFPCSFTYKTAFDSGRLIPIYVDEALPGDTFNLKLTSFARLATPVCPFMDNLYMDFQFFAVPCRLVWDNFQHMMGEQDSPGDSTDYLVPQIVAPDGGFSYQTVFDYAGIPPGVAGLSVNALPFRAMHLIWNEWYRDENLQEPLPLSTGDGPDLYTDYNMVLHRGKRHDYFTSCLPWPQKGPGVELPLGDFAPVYGNGRLLMADQSSTDVGWLKVALPEVGSKSDHFVLSKAMTDGNYLGVASKEQSQGAAVQPNGLYADLSDATAATINSLRQAFQIQKLFERDARGGTRYTELIRSHFGVVSPDARLQRPEYLGGGTTPISIHSVAQTSATDSTSPQGNLAAYGVSGQSGVGFTKSFVEHCYIIGFVSVRADLTYQQGLDRMWSRRSRFDFYWPVLSHLGEQAVLNKEIFAQGPAVVDDDGNAVDDQVFGYQERWAEYRYGVSKITGKLRSTYSTPLDVWHLAQKFDTLPTLGSDFIQENVPLSRVLAVTDEPQIIFDALFSLNKVRPMPLYSVPGMMDHF